MLKRSFREGKEGGGGGERKFGREGRGELESCRSFFGAV
jgi:hypothetical protein